MNSRFSLKSFNSFLLVKLAAVFKPPCLRLSRSDNLRFIFGKSLLCKFLWFGRNKVTLQVTLLPKGRPYLQGYLTTKEQSNSAGNFITKGFIKGKAFASKASCSSEVNPEGSFATAASFTSKSQKGLF